MSQTPFADSVLAYAAAGWPVVPVPLETKTPPPAGFTGAAGLDAGPEQLAAWAVTHASSSIAVRMPAGVIGIDVDDYAKGEVVKNGMATVQAAVERWGPLPPTWSSTARGVDQPSRILFYRVPPGRYATALGPDVEIIQRHHRYAVVAPSQHVSVGAPYAWYDPAGQPSEPPKADELPLLPEAWVVGLADGASVETVAGSRADASALLGALMADDREPCAEVASASALWLQRLGDAHAGSRHETARDAAYELTALAAEGHAGFPDVRAQLGDVWAAVTAGEGREHEFVDLWLTAAAKLIGGGRTAPATWDSCTWLSGLDLSRVPTGGELPPIEGGAVPPGPAAKASPASSGRAAELRGRLFTRESLRDLKRPPALVAGWLQLDSLAWLVGAPGGGKSFLAVDLAACVATGRPWHGHAVAQGPVLYIAAEGLHGLGDRVAAWSDLNKAVPDQLTVLGAAPQMTQSLDVNAVAEIAAEIAPVLIVVDTQARVSIGIEENSSKDTGVLIAGLEHLRAITGACVLTIHHTPRGGTNPRGSTAIEGAAVTVVRSDKDGPAVTISCSKQKDIVEPPDLVLHLTQAGDGAALSSNVTHIQSVDTPNQRKVIDTLIELGGEGSQAKVFMAAGMDKATCGRSLAKLARLGIVRRIDGKPILWRLVGETSEPAKKQVHPAVTLAGSHAAPGSRGSSPAQTREPAATPEIRGRGGGEVHEVHGGSHQPSSEVQGSHPYRGEPDRTTPESMTPTELSEVLQTAAATPPSADPARCAGSPCRAMGHPRCSTGCLQPELTP